MIALRPMEEQGLDVNKVAAEFLESRIDGAWELVKSSAKNTKNWARSKFEKTYGRYIERLLAQHSKAKSFFIRHEPLPIYNFFVPLDLGTERRVIANASATELAAVAPHCFIVASGGSGKTMTMKHLLVSTITGRAKTPIYFELRHLNDGELICDALLRTLQENGLDVDDTYFQVALEAGHFDLMLDGFDELNRADRKRAAKEIQEIRLKYPRNWLVISSRPDQTLSGWSSFTQFQVLPLDLDRAAALAQKTPIDEGLKAHFISELRDGLFARHESFLSNPLLLSIMLLTYSDAANIPDKISIFYSQAYESLFQKHDALKGRLPAGETTSLDIKDFAKVFSAFCVPYQSQR